MSRKAVKLQAVPDAPLKLDLGAGKNGKEGFTKVDRRSFPGIDVITDLTEKWPWDESSVEEAHMSHTLEHFNGVQRVYVMNELYRVLKPGSKCMIITPHWCSSRAYGDFTHQWPPVGEMFYYYLSKTWRKENAPDNDVEWNPQGYNCDFEATWGYGMRQDLMVRNQEYQNFALSNYKEAAMDLHACVIAKK
jgi:hypothetical protein